MSIADKIKCWAIGLLLIYSSTSIAQLNDSLSAKYINDTLAGTQAYTVLHIPQIANIKPKRKIIIAVVDDGFSPTHRVLKNFIYRNPKEIIGNDIDDDGNGYIDDVSGYDVADNDNNVSIPEGREYFFYHGTMVAGIIATMVQRAFGGKAADYVSILPVKALGDKANTDNMENGYAGIAYAVKSGADIIVCAWSGGNYDKEKYQAVFDKAKRKGILIFAAAGNFSSQQIDPPGGINGVYVISAIDSTFKKFKSVNYGDKVDLVANGDMVRAPHPLNEHAYTFGDGTSAAVALVGGCAAVLRAVKPSATPAEVMAALKNTALPLDSFNRVFAGKLGAGLPNLTNAVKYLQLKSGWDKYFNSDRAKGDVVIDKDTKRQAWLIKPNGGFRGITFQMANTGKTSATGPFRFFSGDSLAASYSGNNFPPSLFVPGYPVTIKYTGKRISTPVIISYQANPVDSATLYCSGIKEITGLSGEFTDGSGPYQYANNCDCKWLVTVPEGKRIRFEFEPFDTQPKVDFVYLFDGEKTLQENILSEFSGPAPPPVVISRSNRVLVWFATDATVTAKGWRCKFTATDQMPGLEKPLK